MELIETVQIISIIVTSVISLLALFGVGIYFADRAKYKAGKKNRKEQEREEAEQKRRDDTLRQIIREENKPLDDKIDNLVLDTKEIKDDLAANTKGTVTILRNDMKKSLDFCKNKGYASASDRANWHELYNTYGELGGNHFKEFVDAWKEELDSLPSKPKKVRTKKEDK